MSWYVVHIIMQVKFKDGLQDKYPFWENIVLIEAGNSDEAFAKAEERAKEYEGDCDNSFSWEGRPATWSFAGIRKLLTCQNSDETPKNGTELTYLEMELDNQADFSKLLNTSHCLKTTPTSNAALSVSDGYRVNSVTI